MKTLIIKKRLLLICLLSFGMLVSAVWGTHTFARADVTESSLTMSSVSIKTVDPLGIRFETLISKEDFAAYRAKSATFGTIITTKALLGESELTFSSTGVVNVVAKNFNSYMEDDEDTEIDESLYTKYNAVIVGEYDEANDTYADLPESLYGVTLVARSYVKYTENDVEKIEYTSATSERSIYDVARNAVLDNSTGWTDRVYCLDVVRSVAKNNEVDKVNVNKASDADNTSVAVDSSYGDVLAVQTGSGAFTEGTDYTYESNTLTLLTGNKIKAINSNSTTKLVVMAENGDFILPVYVYAESTYGYPRTIGFDDDQFKDTVVNPTGGSASWCTEDGVEITTGKGLFKYVQRKGLSSNLKYTFKSGLTSSELEALDWDYLEFRVYPKCEGKTTISTLHYFLSNNNSSSGAGPTLTVGQWNVVRIDKATIVSGVGSLDAFNQAFSKYSKNSNYFTLFAINTKYYDNDLTLYFDYIDLRKEGDPNTFSFDYIDNEEVYGLTNGTWAGSYDGAYGLWKGTYGASDWIKFKLNTTTSALSELDWDYVEFKVLAAFNYGEGGRTSWDYINSYHEYGGGNDAGWAVSARDGNWRTFKATKEGIINDFGSLEAFYSDLTTGTRGVFHVWNIDKHGDLYFDYFKFVKIDNTMDFEDDSEISYLRSGTDATWLESATDDKGVTEYGVISYYHGTTEYGGVKFQFNNSTGMTLDDWDNIVVRIRIIRGSDSSYPGTDGSFGTFYIGGTQTSIGRIANGWSTLTITKQQIEDSDQYTLESFWSAFTSDAGARLFWTYDVWGVADWTIQISYISLVKVNGVMGFDSADEITYLRSGTDAEWLASATDDQGVTENGVISYYHGTTAYAGVKFQFNNSTGMTLNDWDKIEIRIRVIRGSSSSNPGTDAYFYVFVIGNTTTDIGSIEGGWSTLTITKDQIAASDQYTAESFWSAFTSDAGARLFWFNYVWDSADWTIQISSISLLKNA